jgi:hypothetical protein
MPCLCVWRWFGIDCCLGLVCELVKDWSRCTGALSSGALLPIGLIDGRLTRLIYGHSE